MWCTLFFMMIISSSIKVMITLKVIIEIEFHHYYNWVFSFNFLEISYSITRRINSPILKKRRNKNWKLYFTLVVKAAMKKAEQCKHALQSSIH